MSMAITFNYIKETDINFKRNKMNYDKTIRWSCSEDGEVCECLPLEKQCK